MSGLNLRPGQGTSPRFPSLFRRLLLLGLLVVAGQIVSMLAWNLPLTQTLAEGTILLAILWPTAYFGLYRPLVREMAERQGMETKLRQNEARLAEAQQMARVGNWEWDFEQNRVWRSDQIHELFKLAPAEFEPTFEGFLKWVHPDDREPVRRSIEQALASGGSFAHDHRLRLHDGSVVHVHDQGEVHRDEQGRPVRMAGTVQDITGRRQAEEALRESETRFRQLAENIGEVFWLVTPEMDRTLYVSPAYEAIWGRTCQRLYESPRDWLEAVHEEDRARIEVAAAQILERGSFREEYRILRPNGELRWIRSRGFPVLDEQGRIIRFAGLAEDITERKRAEQMLQRHSAEILRHREALLELAGMDMGNLDRAIQSLLKTAAVTLKVERISLWDVDPDFESISLRQLYLRSRDCFDGSPLTLRVEDYPRYFEVLRSANRIVADDAQKDPVTSEFAESYLRPLGITSMLDVPIWLRGRLIGIVCHEHVGAMRLWSISEQDFAGSIAELSALALAAEERRQAWNELRKLSEAVAHSPAMALITDAQGCIEYVNPRFCEVTGYRAEEVVGRNTSALGRQDRAASRQMWKILQANQVWRGEFQNQKKDGEEYWELAAIAPITDEHGAITHYVKVAEDITARKLAEKELQTANQELKAFAYTVSHDLKGPLRGIIGYAWELQQRHADGLSERGRFCVGQIRAATQGLDQMIEDLLEFSRLGGATPETAEIHLREAVQGVLQAHRGQLRERGAEVSVEISLERVMGWPMGLQRVLANLIGNALKYSRQARPPRIRIQVQALPDRWRLSVTDNGIGFDMKYHDRLFELFNRLVRTDEYEGTGAGLAIVKKIVEKQGGRVWAESAPGQGATFCVELPLPPRPRQASAD